MPHEQPETAAGLLPPALLVFARELPEPLPGRRLDDFDRDRTQGDGCFDRADRSPVFETRRRALLRHRLRAFNQSADWFVPIDEVADGGDIDALFGAGTDDRNVDRLDQHAGRRRRNLDDGQSAANTGIDA